MKYNPWIVAGLGSLGAAATADAGQTVNYSYDALGRMTQSQVQSGPQSSATEAFQYDPAGNRLQYQVTGSTTDTAVTLSVSNTTVNLSGSGATITVQVSSSTATGVINLTENGVIIGSGWVSNGQASIVVPGYSAGVHSITANYSGDGADATQTTGFTVKVQDLRWLPAVLQLLLNG